MKQTVAVYNKGVGIGEGIGEGEGVGIGAGVCASYRDI